MSDSGNDPSFERSASQPATAPGTVTVWMPLCGIALSPCDLSSAGVSPAGAQPQAFNPCSAPVRPSDTIANKSPPIPLDCGSTSPMTALVAIAASMALPPRSSTCTPARAASGWLAATIPYFVAMRDRPTMTLMLIILYNQAVTLHSRPAVLTTKITKERHEGHETRTLSVRRAPPQTVGPRPD